MARDMESETLNETTNVYYTNLFFATFMAVLIILTLLFQSEAHLMDSIKIKNITVS